jgi:hypothetical protein
MTNQKQLAALISAKVKASRRTQREISRDAGFPNQNFLSMICSGKAKVPLARVPALADALGMHRAELLRLCLEAYEPDLLAVLQLVLPDLPTTSDEIALVRGYRILKEKGVIGTDGVEIRGLRKSRKSPYWSTISRED